LLERPFAVIIAAGGASTRLGEFKPLAWLGDRPLISYALDCAFDISPRVYVLLNSRPQADRLSGIMRGSDASIIFDRGTLPFPGSLPESMAQVEEEMLFLMGCDTPFLDNRLPHLLLPKLKGCGAVVPVWPNGYAEPMAALYLKSHLPLGKIIPNLKSLALAMNAIFIEIATLGIEPASFFNINRPSDFELAETMLKNLAKNDARSLRTYGKMAMSAHKIMKAPFLI